MDNQQLIELWKAEAARPFQGWDFSYLQGRYSEDPLPWSYEAEVRALLKTADAVLDMGTGGGEKLLEFRDALPTRTFATEGYPPNFPIAQANLAPHGITVVRYDSETDNRMPFEDGTFDLILNRHESFDAPDVFRALRPGGVFLTQQVDGRDLGDLYAIFNYSLNYPHVTLANCRQSLESAGLVVEHAYDWLGKASFTDVAALVYFLRAILPDHFSVDRHLPQLLELHQQPKPLQFSIRRFLLQARKPVD
jgi:SAM-dependent methyltransferase